MLGYDEFMEDYLSVLRECEVWNMLAFGLEEQEF